jgi:hypothetical protein
MMHSFFREDILNGAYSSERERYERIFLERRADNQRGHKPRPQMVTAPVERVITTEPVSPPKPAKPAPKTLPLEHRMSLEELARQITGKGKRA